MLQTKWLKAFPSQTFFQMLLAIIKHSFLELILSNLIFSSFLIPAIFTFNQRFIILFLLYLIIYSITQLSSKAPLSFQKYFTVFATTFCFSVLTPAEQYFSANSTQEDPYRKSLSQAILNHQNQCQIVRFLIANCFRMLI